ncbi:hypothetical protein GY45DRAFT_1368857 [Cubamyces sp. BRFM 1775]|nr:hypothetical protein GY45DRAFT_1368857 [Cubamyces sp. BRFM 1775]
MATPLHSAASGSSVAAPPLLPIKVPALDNTFGALLLGSFFGFILYGLTLHQVYRYFRFPAYEKDPIYVKLTVISVLILETLHTALAMHLCYYYLVQNYFRPQALLKGIWSADMLPLITGLLIMVTQTFFARRVFLLNRRTVVIVALVLLLLLGQLGFATACTVEAIIQPDLFNVENLQWLSICAVALVIAADSLLTSCLTYTLYRSRTGIKSTDSILKLLILYTINNGLLTGTLSTIALFTASLLPLHGLNICVVKAYANTLLSVLNSRHLLREHQAQARRAAYVKGGDYRVTEQYLTTVAPSFAQYQSTSQPVLHIHITQDVVDDMSIHSAYQDDPTAYNINISDGALPGV